jgi:hypothetical protein
MNHVIKTFKNLSQIESKEFGFFEVFSDALRFSSSPYSWKFAPPVQSKIEGWQRLSEQ